jgi:hypothetical protein
LRRRNIDSLDNECLIKNGAVWVRSPFLKGAEGDVMKVRIAAAITGLALIAPISAHASSVNYSLTADNAFALYVSSSDSTLGTRIFTDLGGTAGQWATPFSGSFGLSGNAPDYVHVIGFNYTLSNGLWTSPGTINGGGDNPNAFIGSLNISGSGYVFAANGSTSLITAPGMWSGIMVPPPSPDIPIAGPFSSNPGWLTPNGPVADYGMNGVGPWGTVGGIDPTAHWIWSIPDNGEYADFSTEIIRQGSQFGPPTPLPGALPLFAGGLGMIGLIAGRKKRKTARSALA